MSQNCLFINKVLRHPGVLVPLAGLQASHMLIVLNEKEIRKPHRAKHVKSNLVPLRATADAIMDCARSASKKSSSKSSLTGKWKKDYSQSDEMDELYEVAQLPWILRKGEIFFKYLELEHEDDFFRRTINAGGFLRISERYSTSGQMQSLRRRDQRKGNMQGYMCLNEDAISTHVSWDHPNGLDMWDTFKLSEDGEILKVVTTASRIDGTASVTVQNTFTKL